MRENLIWMGSLGSQGFDLVRVGRRVSKLILGLGFRALGFPWLRVRIGGGIAVRLVWDLNWLGSTSFG